MKYFLFRNAGQIRVLELLTRFDERLGLRNVAIDLKHGVMAEQLHPAAVSIFLIIAPGSYWKSLACAFNFDLQ